MAIYKERGRGFFWTRTNAENDFTRGMIRDVPRHGIPPGGVYDAADYLLHEPGVAQKRGGTSYAGPALGDQLTVPQIAYADFPAGGQLVGGELKSADSKYHLFKVTSGTTTDLGAIGVGAGAGTPKLWLGGGSTLLVWPTAYAPNNSRPIYKYDGTNAPSVFGLNTTVNGSQTLPTATLTVASTTGFASTGGTIWVVNAAGSKAQQVAYTGTTATTFTGCTGGALAVTTGDFVTSVPPGAYLAIYKTRLVVGGVQGYENRNFFSPTPDITTVWDSANVWVDSDFAVTGYASLSSALLVFNASHTERLTGTTPEGVSGADMDRAVINGVGCTDERSIVIFNDNAVWANARGVYMSNGAQTDSLTQLGGIDSYWRTLLASYDATTWRISGGLYRTFYIVTVQDNSNNFTTLICNIPTRSWGRLTNIRAQMFSPSSAVQEELYCGLWGVDRIAKLSGMWAPTSSNKNDANGTAVTPYIEFRGLGSDPFIKQFGFAHLTYDMRDAATDNPTLAVSVAAGIEATTYAAVAESPLGETTDATRSRFTIAKVSQGVNVKIQQTNASSKTEIYALETEERPLAPVLGGQ